jgi:cytochrome c oxidase cbb3-type subunit 2
MNHDRIEKNVGWLMALTLIAVSIGGMVQIFPMVFDKGTAKPIDTLEPYTAVQLEGRDIYIREGCTVCHTQMVRTLQFETARYGHYSVAGEDVYERPFLWGSKRTGPDLARVGGRYSDDWHRAHLANPRMVVPASNMPAYPWLFERELDGKGTADKMRTLRTLGVPYTDEDIAGAEAVVAGTTEAEALIAYLQSLGLNMRDYAGGAQ